MNLARYFSPEDVNTIAAAVREAESSTGGEVVPVVVESSDEYDVAAWRGACLGALAVAMAAAVIWETGSFWNAPLPAWIAVPPALGAALGYLAVLGFDPLRRLLVPAEILGLRVARRARAAFLEHEVFATRDRTGILVFVSMFERRVEVLVDSGIAALVHEAEWKALAAEVAAGIRAGRAGAALAAGVRRAGELLEQHGVPRRPDDTNELPDELRTSRR